METKATRLRENWDSDPVSSELLRRVDLRLGTRNKSAVMRRAIAELAVSVIGHDEVQKIYKTHGV